MVSVLVEVVGSGDGRHRGVNPPIPHDCRLRYSYRLSGVEAGEEKCFPMKLVPIEQSHVYADETVNVVLRIRCEMESIRSLSQQCLFPKFLFEQRDCTCREA